MPRKPDKERIEELAEKWLNGTITEAEQEEYDLWYRSFQDHEVRDLSKTDLERVKKRIYRAILEKEHFRGNVLKIRTTRVLMRIALVAASVALFYVAASHIYRIIVQKEANSKELLYSAIAPGGDKATLSLGNGVVFDLDSLATGEIFQQSGVRIEKNENGELVYSATNETPLPAEILMNTVSTPNGGQYRVSLPDGSQVWLNAATQLTFPTAFTGASRTVTLVGEAYFEVAQNEEVPFRVITPTEEVEVLGTHFNVNAYREDGLSTVALLEGKVKVSLPSSEFRVLKPGEQTFVKSGVVAVRPVDLSEAIAWKNGEFTFNDEPMKRVMQKVARWYDVEVILAPELENVAIWGTVSKYENIKEVLKIIGMAGDVRFDIEGRRLYVLK